MSPAHQDESTMNERIKDLKLAASFVKSIETADHTINLEIQQVARHIEGLACQLHERRFNAAEEHRSQQNTA